MISIDRFDADLDRWEQDLASLEATTHAPTTPIISTLLSKLHKLERQQQGLQNMIELCRQAEATEAPISPISRAIIFWAGEWADRVDEFRFRYVDYLDKLLWLNLLRGRLLGRKNHFRLDMTDEDIQQVLQKKQSLEKTEHVLKEELKTLQNQELRMRSQYERFQFELANREAAQSFGPMTHTISQQKPTFEAFGRLLRTLAVHMSHSRPQVKKIQQLTVNFTKRSQILMEHCSSLLRQDPSSYGAPKNRNTRLIHESLLEIKRLEDEIETTLSALSPETRAHRPVLRVKNSSSSASSYVQERPIDQDRRSSSIVQGEKNFGPR